MWQRLAQFASVVSCTTGTRKIKPTMHCKSPYANINTHETQAAESEAEQLRQEAVAVSPAPMAATGSIQPAAAVAQPAAATRASSPQPRGLSPLPQAPGPQPPAADPLALSLPAARLLAKVQTIKAEALLAAAHAMQDKQEDAAKFAVPGKDAVAVKQFLAQAGILVRCPLQHTLLCTLPCTLMHSNEIHLPHSSTFCAQQLC